MTLLKVSSERLTGSGAKVRLPRSAKLEHEIVDEDAKRAMEERELQRNLLSPLNLVYLIQTVPQHLILIWLTKRWVIHTIKLENESSRPSRTNLVHPQIPVDKKRIHFSRRTRTTVSRRGRLWNWLNLVPKRVPKILQSRVHFLGMEIKAHAWQQ
jgi:hypothetical protein